MKPVRIQRKRVKGWKMPPNTLSVTRPGKWGNPFKVTGEEGHWFVSEGDEPIVTFNKKNEAIDCAIELYKEDLAHKVNANKLSIKELRGKNLACFCRLEDKCHADILLEIANK